MPNNNTPDTAENIGILSGSRTFNNFVGTDDRNDYYRFSLNQPRDFSLLLTGLEEDADVALLIDLNDDTQIDDDEVLRSSIARGSSDDGINLTLAAGDYFIRVYTPSESNETEYVLNVETSSTSSTTPSDPGNTFTEALDLGSLSDRQTWREFVGTFDRNDYYRFIIEEPSNFSLLLSDKDDDVEIQLLADLNDDTQVDPDERVRSVGDTVNDQRIDFPIGAGTYYLRIFADDQLDNANYLLNLEASAIPRTTPFDPGNTINTALDIGSVSSRQTFRDFVGLFDSVDYYRFNLTQDADFSLLLSDLQSNANVQVIADENGNRQVDSGEIVASSSIGSSNDDAINTFLEAGTYFVRILSSSGNNNTRYLLNVSSTAVPTNNPPVAINDSAITESNTEVVIPVLANDNDPNGDPIQLLDFTTPDNGNVRRQGSDLIYTPDPNFTGPDSFTYSISDGNGATDTATVNITVTPAPEDALQLRVAPSEPTKAAVPNTSVSFDVNYSTEPAETPITGIAVRMHWDSSQVAFDPVTGLTNLFPFGAQPTGVVEDDPVTNGGFDRDPNTDKYILQAWADAGGNWPNNSNPTLYRANFTALPGFEGTRINFSTDPDDLPANTTFVPSSIDLTPRQFTLDIDGNGVVGGFSDGILALRYLINLRGEALTSGALGDGATRDASEIVTYLDEAAEVMLDVDGNGTAGAFSDGILFLRYAIGLTGDALINGALGEGATRTTETAILDHLQSFDLL